MPSCWPALAAITKHSSSQINRFQRKRYFSQFWKLGVQEQGARQSRAWLRTHFLSSHSFQSGLIFTGRGRGSIKSGILLRSRPFSGRDLESRVHTHCVLVFSLFMHAPWGQLRASLVQSRNIPLSQHHQPLCGQIPSHLCLLPSWALPEVCLESVLLAISSQTCFFPCSS